MKAYQAPTSVPIRLSIYRFIAASAPGITISDGGDDDTVDADKVEVKRISDDNIWDEEW